MTALGALDAELASWPGRVSVWCAAIGAATPAYARRADERHYAASTMKVAVLIALYRAAAVGAIDLDAPVRVANDFASAKPGAPRFAIPRAYDHDDDVWARLDGTATPRWLGRHMIVRSSNLATNVLLDLVGTLAIADVLRDAGARNSRVERGIADTAASDDGIDNEVTVRDLAALFGAIVRGAAQADSDSRSAIAGPTACAEMLDMLCAQEHRVDIATGLPPGTRVAHKNGWVTGVRHSAGVVFPDDAAPYVLAVCTTSEDADDEAACALIGRVAAASWADRHVIAAASDVAA
ncbi:MAG TPA: serine hydrolase [Micromonosporaceae bacterium]|nr:serine hydrolase [Micromonosporaceae bacterium]